MRIFFGFGRRVRVGPVRGFLGLGKSVRIGGTKRHGKRR